METRLEQIRSSIQDQNQEIQVLRARSERLERELRAEAPAGGRGPEVAGEAVLSLTEELHSRLRLGEQLEAEFSGALWELRSAEETVKVSQSSPFRCGQGGRLIQRVGV